MRKSVLTRYFHLIKTRSISTLRQCKMQKIAMLIHCVVVWMNINGVALVGLPQPKKTKQIANVYHLRNTIWWLFSLSICLFVLVAWVSSAATWSMPNPLLWNHSWLRLLLVNAVAAALPFHFCTHNVCLHWSTPYFEQTCVCTFEFDVIRFLDFGWP